MGSHRMGVVRILMICSGLLAVLAASAPMFAQTPTSTILGAVKDSTGGTVPGAIVTVTNTDTGIARTATTGEDGALCRQAVWYSGIESRMGKCDCRDSRLNVHAVHPSRLQ